MRDDISVRHDSPDCAGYARASRGTGFCYCPPPNRRVRWAVRRASNDLAYPPALAWLAAFGLIGAALVFGGALLGMLGLRL